MPIYSFECGKCGARWDDTFSMKEEKQSRCPGCKKIGNRIFTVPRMAVDSKISPFDLKNLTRKTGQMRGSVGNLFDMAKETSEARGGEHDPIRKKALQDYAKLRRGKTYRDPNEPVSIEFRIRSDPTEIKKSPQITGKSGETKARTRSKSAKKISK